MPVCFDPQYNDIINLESDCYDDLLINTLTFRRGALTGVSECKEYKPYELERYNRKCNTKSSIPTITPPNLYLTLHVVLCGITHKLYYDSDVNLRSDYAELVKIMGDSSYRGN